MTTPKPTHSPLPWSINLWTTGRVTVDDKSGMQVAELSLTHEGQGTTVGNAEFVRLAVNAHDALVEIALLAEDICRLLAEGKPVPLNYTIQKIDKALRLTGEETK